MKKHILLILPLLAILFIGACASQQQQTQNQTVINTCDDGNPCHQNILNTVTNQCEHRIIPNCCGNGICEDNERCNSTTHQTVCPQDCKYTCPAYLTVGKFSCATQQCQETADNTFTLSGSSVLEAPLENIGEAGTGTIQTQFKCGQGVNYITNNKDSIFGVTFSHGFKYLGNVETDVDLSGHQSETGANKASYDLNIEYTKAQASKIDCDVSLQSQNTGLNYLTTVHLTLA